MPGTFGKLRLAAATLALTALAFAAGPVVGPKETYTAAERRHWAFQPRSKPVVPTFQSESARAWVANPIDAFVLSRLQKEGLKPAPKASRRTLIRRVYFDLTGLPPTPAEVEQFVADPDPHAWEKLVDRLLASPEYGERAASHWFDTVRYAESDGFEYDTHRSDMWRYRDYVIRSFQTDKPYDVFVREQLAGDELAGKVATPQADELMIASGFHRLGPLRKNAGNQDIAYNRNEVLIEMTNVIGSAFLGMTIGCARCHDHKFDPIRQKDYYRMQAFFAPTQQVDVPLYTDKEEAEWKKKNGAIEAEMARLRKSLPHDDGPARQAIELQLIEKEKELPQPLPLLSTVANDPKQFMAVHVLTRGNSAAPLDKVAARVPGVLLPDGAPELDDDDPQPRTTLANWITDPSNPLPSRVMVNRIWQSHFGTGIVATPNDFGRMGARPSHPELLDWLANKFVDGRFRIKAMHRMILLSNTYQQSYIPASTVAAETDPENKYLWRFPRRRLEAEEIRDSILAVAGRLNLQKGGPSVIVPVEPELLRLAYKPSQWAVNPDEGQFARRSIYLYEKRNLRLPFLEVFDLPDRLLSCARRESSTHAPQALELMNGTLTRGMSLEFARRLDKEAGGSIEKQVDLAYRLATARPPLAAEKSAAVAFLKENPLSEFTLAMFLVNDFLYVN